MINKVILITVVAAFLGGLLLGYGIWTQRQVEEKTDIKTLLTEAIKRVEALKQENRNFQKEVAAARVATQEKKLVESRAAQLEVNINVLKEENANLKDTTDKLQQEMAAMQSAAPESEEQSGDCSDQETQLVEAREKNKELAAQLGQAEKMQKKLQETISRQETELASRAVGETKGESLPGEKMEEDKMTRLNELESTNQSLSSDIQRLQEENQGLKSTVARLEKALNDSKNQSPSPDEGVKEGGAPSQTEGEKVE